MSHNYLLDTYRYIEQRRTQMERRQKLNRLSSENTRYIEGRMAALDEIHAFLSSNFDAMLPRRLRNKSI